MAVAGREGQQKKSGNERIMNISLYIFSCAVLKMIVVIHISGATKCLQSLGGIHDQLQLARFCGPQEFSGSNKTLRMGKHLKVLG